MEQDTTSKSAPKELSPALLQATVAHLAKANKAISLSDIIKYLTCLLYTSPSPRD